MGIREETEKKVFAYIEDQGMILPGDRIVAGVSGGADSVCLLLLLQAYGRKVPLALAVVHVDHGIREDAMEDARYVEGLCGKMGIPFFLTQRDVKSLAREEKCSEEDAGRRARYQAFRQAAERMGGGKVAVAHNSDDNAETMLFHLFRGSGIKGIGGIPPVRKDGRTSIIRPILCLEREEVEAYLREREVPWRTDSTNSGDSYRRNRIRHHILPYVQQEIAAGAVGHMSQTARQLRETESYLAEQTESALRACLLEGEDAREGGCPAEPADARGNSRVPELARAWDNGRISESADVQDNGRISEPADVQDNGRPPDSTGAWDNVRPPEPAGARDIGYMPELAELGAGRCVLDVAAFRGFHVVLQKRMLFGLIKRLSPTGKDISAVHVHDTLTLFDREGNRTITLPFGITAWRQYGQVVLERRAEPTGRSRESMSAKRQRSGQAGAGICMKPPGGIGMAGWTADQEAADGQQSGQAGICMKPPGKTDMAGWTASQEEAVRRQSLSGLPAETAPPWGEQPVPVPLGEEIFRTPFVCPLGDGEELEFSAFFIKKDRELPKNQCTKWFDYDKMEECVVVRSRTAGDYFTISDGAGNTVRKSLKKYMIAEKIPKQLRDGMPLVAMGSHVLWLVGRRISEHFKVDGNTERVLQVRWNRGCKDSETEEKDVRAH